MENPTSFDLNLAIQQWRETLAQSPAFRSENLDELESHLRDSTAVLQTRGLSAEEAFMVATKRMGKRGSLETEFGKVNGQAVWLDRILWMLIGVQVWGLVSGVVSSVVRGALSFGLAGANFDFTSHGRAIPVVLFTLVQLLAIVGSLAICWWLIVRKGQNFGAWIGRLLQRPVTLAVTCGLLCVLSLAIWTVSHGIHMLLLRFTSVRVFGEISTSLAYSSLFVWVTQVAALLTLTLLLARKRLRMREA